MAEALSVLQENMVERDSLIEFERKETEDKRGRADRIQLVADQFDDRITSSFSEITNSIEKLHTSADFALQECGGDDAADRTDGNLDRANGEKHHRRVRCGRRAFDGD